MDSKAKQASKVEDNLGRIVLEEDAGVATFIIESVLFDKILLVRSFKKHLVKEIVTKI